MNSKSNAELLPCPHCGESEELYPAYRSFDGGIPYAIDCLGCGADFVPREGTDAIEAWNRRPSRLEAISEAEPVAWMVEDLILPAKRFTDDAAHAKRMREFIYEGKPIARVIPLYAHTPPAGHVVVPVDGWKPPDDCDGIEQDAFEAWAASERYDMEQHPLHWLFLNVQTAAARNGWRAGIRHARDRYRAMLAAPSPKEQP